MLMLLVLQRLVEHSDPVLKKAQIKYSLTYFVECFFAGKTNCLRSYPSEHRQIFTCKSDLTCNTKKTDTFTK